MKTFACICGQRLFFENTQCLSCGRRVGWCPSCEVISALENTSQEGIYQCTTSNCGTELQLCYNYSNFDVCNRCVMVDQTPYNNSGQGNLCDMCSFNDTIPDLSIEGNLDHWRRLEFAKRRVLRQFKIYNLPPFDGNPDTLTLSFDFKADAIPTELGWRPMGEETVYTGHDDGKITINIREADSVERERLRINFGESYRTLIGHFRHELAHYLYDACIPNSNYVVAFAETFGDPNNPEYDEALESYYHNGPRANWSDNYISAYATMHPFEDWAETVAALFHGHCILETAIYHGYLDFIPSASTPDKLLDQIIDLGVFLNEVSKEMGLLDVLPGIINEPVREKMKFARQVLL